MIVGKIISILDVSIKVILSSNDLEVGDILTTEDGKFAFEVVIIDSVEATCITLNSNHGLKKGTRLIKKAKGIANIKYTKANTVATDIFTIFIFILLNLFYAYLYKIR